MSTKRRSVLAISIFMIAAVILSACTQSLSAAPAETPTLIPTGLFVSPIASVENPMEMIEQFAKQTEAAQTAAAGGGTTGTPQAVSTTTTGTPGTPVPAVATETPTVAAVTPTNAAVTSAPVATSASVATAPSLSGDTYILQNGEWPYCIARRYDVDPEAMLKASGLTSPDIYYPGLKLILPQSTNFPGSRVLIAHPASYTVASGDETVYSIACKYGDVDPNAIASTNGISASAKLTVGQVLKIP
ncbi:MAG: LysM peptidoglycan-binding domain-containing protein [Chloroflexi bacterium]|nr:LysM peptidoglycan-binding domain-containing protein [Chloroflexota bacterium]MBI3168114.1 LysM peptidoglycan-binding domain-containing protein [Chloroflexota bacterium]